MLLLGRTLRHFVEGGSLPWKHVPSPLAPRLVHPPLRHHLTLSPTSSPDCGTMPSALCPLRLHARRRTLGIGRALDTAMTEQAPSHHRVILLESVLQGVGRSLVRPPSQVLLHRVGLKATGEGWEWLVAPAGATGARTGRGNSAPLNATA